MRRAPRAGWKSQASSASTPPSLPILTCSLRASAAAAPTKRQIVLLGRVRALGVGCDLAIRDERRDVVRGDAGGEPVGEGRHVRQRRFRAAALQVVAQVVRRVSRAHDEDALACKRGERAPEGDVVRRAATRRALAQLDRLAATQAAADGPCGLR